MSFSGAGTGVVRSRTASSQSWCRDGDSAIHCDGALQFFPAKLHIPAKSPGIFSSFLTCAWIRKLGSDWQKLMEEKNHDLEGINCSRFTEIQFLRYLRSVFLFTEIQITQTSHPFPISRGKRTSFSLSLVWCHHFISLLLAKKRSAFLMLKKKIKISVHFLKNPLEDSI